MIRLAALKGHLAVVECLLADRRVNPAADGNDAIRWAAKHGRLAVVERLLADTRVDPAANNNEAIRWAAENGHWAVMERLLAKPRVDAAALSVEQKKSLKAWQAKNRAAGDAPAMRHLAWMLREELCREGVSDREAHDYSSAAAWFFRDADRFAAWAGQWGVKTKQPLHDLLHELSMPKDAQSWARVDWKSWRNALMTHGPVMAKFVKFAHLSPRAPNGPEAAIDALWAHAYTRAGEDETLARTSLTHGLSEKDFNTALDIDKNHPRSNAPSRIPDITLDGAAFDMPGWRFRKLADDDAAQLFIGALTGCCQHIGGQGKDSVIHTWGSPDAGFYVLEDRGGKIRGHAWAYRDEVTDALVLESLEARPAIASTAQWSAILTGFAAQLKGEAHSDIPALLVGNGGRTPPLPGWQTDSRETHPKGASPNMYRDKGYARYVIAQFDAAQRANRPGAGHTRPPGPLPL